MSARLPVLLQTNTRLQDQLSGARPSRSPGVPSKTKLDHALMVSRELLTASQAMRRAIGGGIAGAGHRHEDMKATAAVRAPSPMTLQRQGLRSSPSQVGSVVVNGSMTLNGSMSPVTLSHAATWSPGRPNGAAFGEKAPTAGRGRVLSRQGSLSEQDLWSPTVAVPSPPRRKPSRCSDSELLSPGIAVASTSDTQRPTLPRRSDAEHSSGARRSASTSNTPVLRSPSPTGIKDPRGVPLLPHHRPSSMPQPTVGTMGRLNQKRPPPLMRSHLYGKSGIGSLAEADMNRGSQVSSAVFARPVAMRTQSLGDLSGMLRSEGSCSTTCESPGPSPGAVSMYSEPVLVEEPMSADSTVLRGILSARSGGTRSDDSRPRSRVRRVVFSGDCKPAPRGTLLMALALGGDFDDYDEPGSGSVRRRRRHRREARPPTPPPKGMGDDDRPATLRDEAAVAAASGLAAIAEATCHLEAPRQAAESAAALARPEGDDQTLSAGVVG
eukprot:TRINITY_DN40793_c0_g1_i1.p1 TRINITY_DN40793_c0_g1~~TRINITY_DN40793_c0_g1_i1.p1  ORF type:complete len:495 (+),score=37.98 TRINITY_DN40793_c0_g1_i1:151-1635(+)